MQSLMDMLVERLEMRRLFSAHVYMSGKNLEVLGDPQFENYIDIDYTDATKTTVHVTVLVRDPAQGPASGAGYVDDYFPAAKIKTLCVRGGNMADVVTIDMKDLGFNINTQADLVGGDDLFYTRDANSTVNGGDGNDSITCGNGRDILRGGAGNDMLCVGKGPSKIDGGDGNDLISTGGGRDTINGGAGNDFISSEDAFGGGTLVYGGAGDDRIDLGNGNDTVWGGLGNDTIWAGGGNETFGVGLGHDNVFNGVGHATYYTRNIKASVTSYSGGADKIVHTISKSETTMPKI